MILFVFFFAEMMFKDYVLNWILSLYLAKSQHTKIPFISDRKKELNKFEFVGGTLSKPWLIKIHGMYPKYDDRLDGTDTS